MTKPDVVHLSMRPQPVASNAPEVDPEIAITEEITKMQKTIAFLMRQHGISKVEITSTKRVYVDTGLGTTYVFFNNELLEIRNG